MGNDPLWVQLIDLWGNDPLWVQLVELWPHLTDEIKHEMLASLMTELAALHRVGAIESSLFACSASLWEKRIADQAKAETVVREALARHMRLPPAVE